MADKKISSSTRADKAYARIEAALVRLEAAVGAKAAQSGGHNGDSSSGEMAEQLSAARQEISALKARNHEVSGRLDGAIERVKALVGE